MSAAVDPNVALRRVRALLAKAEGTDNPAEAEAFSAKAFELMDKYRLDLADVRGSSDAELVRHSYRLVGNRYLRASMNLLVAVCEHYGVIIMVPSTGNSKTPTLVGDRDDVSMAITMFESLVIQRDRACLADPIPVTWWGEPVNTNKHRNSFCYGYAYRIGQRLKEIRRAQRATVTTDGNNRALEVFDRGDQVRRLIEEASGKKLTSRNENKPKIDGASAARGDDAARRADLGQSKVGPGGGSRALGVGR